MNDLAMRFHFTAGGETEGLKTAIQSIPSTMNQNVVYFVCA